MDGHQAALTPPFRSLPPELTNEIVLFVSGPICRNCLISANFLLYRLLHTTKRAKYWRINTDKLREEGTAYAIGDRRIRALIPRNEAHRDVCKFYRGLSVARRKKYGGFLPRGLCTKMFDDDYEQQKSAGIKYFVSLRTKPEHRHILRNLFASQQTINEMCNSYTCQFSFVPIDQPNVPWDLCAFTFGSARDLIRQWTPFMQKLFDILNSIDAGQNLTTLH